MIESAVSAREKLKSLAAFRSSHGTLMSVTLSTSRLDDWRQVAPTFLNSEFGRISKERGAGKEERRVLQEDFDYIVDTLQYDIRPDTQGLAVFVDGEAGLQEKIELPMRLANRLVVEPSPYIRPLIHALSLLEPFVTVRVSRDESSIYLVDEWRLTREDDLTGPWLRSSDKETGELSIKEYYAAARQDTLVDQHFKEVGGKLAKLLETTGVRRVVLSALHDIGNSFRRSLPAAVAAKIVAEIPFDAAATTAQMLVSAREAVAWARNAQIEQMVLWVRDAVGTGGRGVSGFDDVLEAIRRHQVQTVIVDGDFRVAGWRCLACDWVGLSHVERCPICDEPTVAVEDAVGEVIRLSVLQSAHVEVGENIAALTDLGGIAGVLRYP
jgi:peptide chain release factor subunit 1